MKTLTEIEVDVLRSLLKFNYLTCATLGTEVWQGGRGSGARPRNRRSYANCSCPFARPASAVVRRLAARGLVIKHVVLNDHRTFWRATAAGERAYMATHVNHHSKGAAK